MMYYSTTGFFLLLPSSLIFQSRSAHIILTHCLSLITAILFVFDDLGYVKESLINISPASSTSFKESHAKFLS